ncbi:hypothetical protein EBR78_00800 [bacterium]|nr:hypothetical protein [bacterium]NBX81756.1 hypothetical protein [bacterium]
MRLRNLVVVWMGFLSCLVSANEPGSAPAPAEPVTPSQSIENPTVPQLKTKKTRIPAKKKKAAPTTAQPAAPSAEEEAPVAPPVY